MMLTCQKCRKQNPPDAVFCGFCGAKLSPVAAPAAQARTVFGYTAEAKSAAAPIAPEPASPHPAARSAPRLEEPAVRPAPHPAPAAAPAPLPAPAQVAGGTLVGGRYAQGPLLKKLPTGELYQAKDVNDGTEAELLIVDQAVFPSPLDMERGRREIRQLQKVESPALCKILEHGRLDDGRLFLILQPARGKTLDEVLARQGRMDLAQAQHVVREVGTALAEAQKMGVIHRDIAPFNIILGSAGEVSLRGFALAAPIKKHVFGTAEFISPEQASGRPVDQRSNIYSLGALLFYLLTGEPPFRGRTPEEQLEQHQNEEAVSPNQRCPELRLSGRVEALILKALAKSSSRRHLTLRQFLREVESLTDAAPVAAEPSAPPLSFVTPLHGVTALTGGRRPPSAELSSLTADSAATLIEKASLPTTEPMPAPLPSTDPLGPSLPPSHQVIPLVGGRPAAHHDRDLLVSASEPASLEPPPAAPVPAKGRQNAITGEMSSAVSLKQAPPSTEIPRAPTRPPAAAPPAAGGSPGKQGFRETMWFFKGEVESAMAETGADAAAPATTAAEATPQELTAKYADDGSLTEEEASRLSLRTGKTQMMMQVKVPTGGPLPGDKMAAEDFIHEMNRGRRIAIWSGIVLVLALVASLAYWLATK